MDRGGGVRLEFCRRVGEPPIFDRGSKYLYGFLVELLHHQRFSVTHLVGTVVAGWAH